MTDSISRVWDIIERAGVGMLTTRFDGGLRARPLEPRPDRNAGVIRFITDVRSAKEEEISAQPDACFVVFEAGDKAYLSITGRAETNEDRSVAAKIWRSTDTVWWRGGPEDPNVSVIEFHPETAELWDGPASKTVAAFEFVKARITGGKPNLGENRKVTVRMRSRTAT